MQKLSDDVFPKGERDSSVVLTPAIDLLIGVGPKEITQQTGIRNIGRSNDTFDLVQARKLWAETSVHAKDLLIDNSCARETVEAVCERLPKLDTKASLTLVIEAVNAVNRRAFMVTTENKEILWVFDLVRQQEADRFQTLFTAVDVITEEDVIRLWWEASVLEQSQEIVILPMDIAADLNWSFQLQ